MTEQHWHVGDRITIVNTDQPIDGLDGKIVTVDPTENGMDYEVEVTLSGEPIYPWCSLDELSRA